MSGVKNRKGKKQLARSASAAMRRRKGHNKAEKVPQHDRKKDAARHRADRNSGANVARDR